MQAFLFFLFFFVGGHQLGHHAADVPSGDSWKLGIRIVTTFIVFQLSLVMSVRLTFGDDLNDACKLITFLAVWQ